MKIIQIQNRIIKFNRNTILKMISNNVPIPIYQHPFVDVFKHIKLTDWVTSHKEGDVQPNIWDKVLAKNVIRIQGTSSSSNYIQVPATKFLPKKALGLTGKYIFLMIQKPDQKNCVIHLDYLVNETRLTKISLSNIYKEFKNVNGSSLQIPLTIQSDKWTIVCLNIFDILENNKIFLPNQPQKFYLRSFQICSTISVKGVYTSDIPYQPQNLPKDMQFKVPKDQDWYSEYTWFQFPQGQEQQTAKIQNPKNQNSDLQQIDDNQLKLQQKKRPQTAIKANQKSSKNNKQTQNKQQQGNKNVKFDNEESDQEQLDATTESETQVQSQNQQSKINVEEIEEFNGQIEKTMKEIETLKEDYKYNLSSKDITKDNEIEITLYQDQSLYNPKLQQQPNDTFILKPNPIMRLDRVIGWHPHYTSNRVYFNHDPKLSKEIIYTQANMMLGYYPPLQKQRLFYERQTNNIDQLFVENCANNSNFAFTICKSLEEKSKDNEVTIWSLVSLETTNSTSQSIITFKPPFKIIISINISCGEEMEFLCIGGKDQQMRDLMVVYKFQDIIKFKKVEIYARQLIDFETFGLKLNPLVSNSVVACGKEGIKLFKIKNGHIPGNAVILNSTGRGKYFQQIVFQNSGHQPSSQPLTTAQNKNQKPTYIFVTTQDGLLYFVNYNTRQIDKIIQIHEEQISSIVVSRNDEFIVSISLSGVIRIWSTDFENLKSEVKTGTQVAFCDINYDCNQICVLSSQSSSISILDLQTSSYNVVLRSHQDNLIDISHNQMTGKLVTLGEDYCVKVWNADTMEQLNEFVSENDLPIRVVCQNQGFLEEGTTSEHTDSLAAIGFKSGFLRIIDLDNMAVVHETMLFQSPVMDIQFSLDNKFMAVFFKSGKIVIINKERPGVFQPIKNIDYELPNQNYCSISFSFDSTLLANISSNANTITVWETRNFSLRYHLDITGDLIQKIEFAPNGRDLVLLTTSSKIKVYRLGQSARDQEMSHVKDYYGITELECVDFTVSSNNKFIVCAGKEGVIKVYDYFMRGYPLASTQAFLGHFKFPKRIFLQKDLRNLYSVGDLNGIYKWTFYGDKSLPLDISQYCEQLEEEKIAKASMSQAEIDKQKADEGLYEADALQQYSQKQIDQLKQQIQDNNQNQQMQSQNMAANGILKNNILTQQNANPFLHTIDMNGGGYLYEQFELKLKKVLACSNGQLVYNNLVWNNSQRYIVYSIQNVIVIESLNQEKTQRLLKEGHDQIYQIKMSPNKKYLLAYTKTGPLDGFPCIYIFDSVNFKKLNQIAISDGQIDSVEFSGYSNMLLVVSSTKQGEDKLMTNISVWDFIDGHKDIFCKSVIPIEIKASCWNPYIEKNGDEFVTLSDRCYHYWRITENLQLQYQEGELPQKQSEGFADKQDMFTTLCFVKPDQLHHSVYLMIGLQSGYVWICDTRVNQYLFNVKVLDASSGGIQRIFSSHCRIVVEPKGSQTLHCWDQSGKNGDKEYSAYNPFNFFIGTESTLSIDGNYMATFYDDTGNQIIALSSSGSIWYMSWIDNATLRLKSCHRPSEAISCADFKYVSPKDIQIEEEQDQGYTFDQNYQIASASSDGQIKLWNMHDLEYSQQFIVPKEKCVTIAMHQFKPYMVCSFTDGYLRFFDLSTSKLLGRCLVHSGIEDVNPKTIDKTEENGAIVDTVVSIKILPSGNHILIATKNGQIILVFVQTWSPMAVRMVSLVSIHTSINQFEFSYLEPYNKWLVSTSNGKVIVYNRKDFNSLNQEIFDELKPPVFNYMDSFNLLEFVSNGFSYTQRCNTLDHYYSMAKRNLVYNEVEKMHECEGVFSKNDLTLHLCFIRQCNQLIIRNFELHQVVKKIEMSSVALPITMQLMPSGSSPFVCIALSDNTLKLIDYMNEDNQSSILTMHEQLITMKVCPNARYVLTGGSSGDISLWSIQKKILQPDLINTAIKQVAA